MTLEAYPVRRGMALVNEAIVSYVFLFCVGERSKAQFVARGNLGAFPSESVLQGLAERCQGDFLVPVQEEIRRAGFSPPKWSKARPTAKLRGCSWT